MKMRQSEIVEELAIKIETVVKANSTTTKKRNPITMAIAIYLLYNNLEIVEKISNRIK